MQEFVAKCKQCGIIERGDREECGDALEDHDQFHAVQIQRVATDGGRSVDGTDRVMVDIETLGLDRGAAILSIGAVEFDSHGPKDSFSRSIDLVSCQEAGLTIDADTLDWWLRQDERAREQLTGGDDLADVLTAFRDWYVAHGFDEVWANSPSFDCEMLEAACAAVGLDEPWHFQDERDFRTIRSLPVDVELSRNGVEHDALDDAIYQARVVAAVLDEVDRSVNTRGEHGDGPVTDGGLPEWATQMSTFGDGEIVRCDHCGSEGDAPASVTHRDGCPAVATDGGHPTVAGATNRQPRGGRHRRDQGVAGADVDVDECLRAVLAAVKHLDDALVLAPRGDIRDNVGSIHSQCQSLLDQLVEHEDTLDDAGGDQA